MSNHASHHIMKRQHVLGIDLGTQQLKVAVMDVEDFQILSSVQAPVESTTNGFGYVEQDPEAWWKTLLNLVPEALAKCGAEAEEIACIGLSGHMHSIVPLADDGSVVRRCIVWADTRSTAQAEAIQEKLEALWNPSISAYSVSKLLWLRENESHSFEQMRHVLFPKDYLRYRLTKQIATDASDASGSLVWDFDTHLWDREAIRALELPLAVFPPVAQATEMGGRLAPDVAQALGLVAGTPVATGAGDVASALVGSGVRKDSLLINAGTAAQVIVPDVQPTLYTKERGARYLFELGRNTSCFVMGALPSAGLSINWWRQLFDSLDANLGYEDLDALAKKAPPETQVLFLPYLQGTGTPYARDEALGSFLKLSASTDLQQLTRSVMEGVAFGIKLCTEHAIQFSSHDISKVVITGGITKSSVLRDLISQMFGNEVVFASFADASLAGALSNAVACITGEVADFEVAQDRSKIQPHQSNSEIDLEYLQDKYEQFKASAETLMLTQH